MFSQGWFDPYPVIRAPVLTAPVSEAAVEYDPAEPTYQALKAQFAQTISLLTQQIAQIHGYKDQFKRAYIPPFQAAVNQVRTAPPSPPNQILAAVRVALQFAAQSNTYRQSLQQLVSETEQSTVVEANRLRNQMTTLAKERMRTAGTYDAMKIWEARSEQAGLPTQPGVPAVEDYWYWTKVRDLIASFSLIESVSEYTARIWGWRDRLWGVEPGRAAGLDPKVEPVSRPVEHAKVGDEAQVEAARRARIFELAKPLRNVIDSIPWPHEFFRNFILEPQAAPSPFYRDVYIYDLENLLTANYFLSTPPLKIERDVATYLKQNGSALEKHFAIMVQRWIEEKRKQQEEEAAKRGAVGFIIGAIGLLAGPLLGAVGSIAASAISGGFKLFSAYQMADDARAAMKQAQALLNISDDALHKFSEWIAARTLVGFAVTVEDKRVATMPKEAEAESLALKSSVIGDRVEIVNLATGQSSGLLLRSEVGLIKLPPEQESQIRAMSHEALAKAVQAGTIKAKAEAKPGFPWWMILIPLVAK